MEHSGKDLRPRYISAIDDFLVRTITNMHAVQLRFLASAVGMRLFLANASAARQVLHDFIAPVDPTFKALVEIVQAETSSEFAGLNAQVIVSLWGMFESNLLDFALNWVAHYPGARTHDQVKIAEERVKKKLVASGVGSETLGSEEYWRSVVAELERRSRVGLKPGVDKFEELFAAIGLGGDVDENTRRDLLEFAATRNVLMHKKGIVDQRFQELCPHTGRQAGELLIVGYLEISRFDTAAYGYLTEIEMRARMMF